jgi:hypothetical protein
VAHRQGWFARLAGNLEALVAAFRPRDRRQHQSDRRERRKAAHDSKTGHSLLLRRGSNERMDRR